LNLKLERRIAPLSLATTAVRVPHDDRQRS
jgi:hypothetical protein